MVAEFITVWVLVIGAAGYRPNVWTYQRSNITMHSS